MDSENTKWYVFEVFHPYTAVGWGRTAQHAVQRTSKEKAQEWLVERLNKAASQCHLNEYRNLKFIGEHDVIPEGFSYE